MMSTLLKRLIISSVLLMSTSVALVGCATLEQKQGQWIFNPTQANWGGAAAAEGMQEVWIPYTSRIDQQAVKLHGLWLAADKANAPVLLYLHGARWNVNGSASRVRRMHELGFSVLVVDYRGFGKTSTQTPSEAMAYEDAKAAWSWLAQQHPNKDRYIFGHSLGGAIGIHLASQVDDEKGVIVEGTFTSIPDVFSSMQWGWLPVKMLITQRFESIKKVALIGSPLLVVHGSDDRLIHPALGQQLFDAALGPKKFVMVDGGSHHNTNSVGQAQYRLALKELFNI
jgi:uncharacterized protein